MTVARPKVSAENQGMFARLPVLLVDCQTTGTRAGHDHIIELAWARTTAEAIADGPGAYRIESSLVRLPAGVSIPRAAQAISGLNETLLGAAPTPPEVWNRFRAAFAETPVAVAHYARFEEGFIRHWAAVQGEAFPFEPALLCTHKFARRLLPGLPSASLRAVAGFLGRDLPELRRAAENVAATAWIWERLVARFELEEASAQSVPFVEVAEFRAWLEMKVKKVRVPTPRAYVTPRETRLALPDAPGIYRFLSRNGRVLYVGKATSLKDRVNSYYRSRQTTRKKLKELMAQVHDVRVTEVATDVEAALLETDEIKSLRPPYNIALRGQKNLPAFCTRDFSEVATTPHRLFPLGPFVSIDTFDELHAVVAALEEGQHLGALFWGMVEEDVVAEGVETFRERHGLSDSVTPAELLQLGAARLAEPEAEVEEEKEERVWDAEEVADSLERRLAGLVRNIRRARWRCRLTDATVAWEVPGRGRRCLEIRAAQIVNARWLELGEPLPVPAEWRRPWLERQGLVVGESFDRMRVAMTEIRRVAAHTQTTILLGPGRRVLTSENLGTRYLFRTRF